MGAQRFNEEEGKYEIDMELVKVSDIVSSLLLL